MKKNKDCLKAFTLIEIIVVIALIASVFSILMLGSKKMRHKARIAQAKAEMQEIEMALKRYRSEFGRWPGQVSGESDATYETDKHFILLSALTNAPAEISYKPSVEIMRNSAWLDPWNRGYVIAVDANNDGLTLLSSAQFYQFETNVQDVVAIMSWGEDTSDSDGKIFSWSR